MSYCTSLAVTPDNPVGEAMNEIAGRCHTACCGVLVLCPPSHRRIARPFACFFPPKVNTSHHYNSTPQPACKPVFTNSQINPTIDFTLFTPYP